MKQLLFAAALAAGLTFGHQLSFAQNTPGSLAGTSTGHAPAAPHGAISAKALRDFSATYHSASGAQWSQLKDRGFMCVFQMNGVGCRAYYDAGGSWLYTMAGYQEEHLPAHIRETVHTSYYGYTISFVQEITMNRLQTIYLVQISRGKTLKILRVTAEDLEELEEWTN